MDDLWQQFHRLPKAIRDAVATRQALAAVERLEQANPGLDLADVVMRLMIKEFAVSDLPKKLEDEGKLSREKSQAVAKQVQAEVLVGVADYLGLSSVQTVPAAKPAPINKKPVGAAPINLPVAKPLASTPPAPSAPPPPREPSRPLGQPPLGKTPTPPVAGLGIPAASLSVGSSVPQPATPPSAGLGMPRPATVSTAPTPAQSAPASRPPEPATVPPAPWSPKPVKPLPVQSRSPVSMPTAAKVIPPPTQLPTATNSPLSSSPPIPTVAAAPKSTSPVAPTQEYSEEETLEIERQAQHVKTLPGNVADFDELSKNILDQHHLAWPDELMTRRAQAIAKARLKEIRNSAQTELMLTREPKLGGLGLDPELAKQLTADLETEAGRLKAKGMVRPPEPVEPPPPVIPPPVSNARPIGQPPLMRTIPPMGLPASQPIPTNVTESPRMSRPIKRPADIPAPTTAPVAAAPASQPLPKAPTVMQRPRQADRPTVSDISRPTKTFGPGEEMKSLTLTEWRRLGQGAAESARVILDKFKHLQRESFVLWTAALAGWRLSEVYQLYLEMGRQSLDQGLSIQEVIGARARNGQTYLSEHEFFTITDLNRMLQH